MHVLIIDDEPLSALVMKLLSQDCGATSVDIVNTRPAAVAAASVHRPGVIVANLALGDGGGGDAVRSIRAQMGPVPVIYLAGVTSHGGRLTPYDKVLGKPINERAFARALKQLQSVAVERNGELRPDGRFASL